MDEVKKEGNHFGGLRCTTADCGQLLFEVDQSILDYYPKAPVCHECSGVLNLVLYSYNEMHLGRLNLRYRCGQCREAFDFKLPSIRKYCKGCKTYQHLFLYAFFGMIHSAPQKLPER